MIYRPGSSFEDKLQISLTNMPGKGTEMNDDVKVQDKSTGNQKKNPSEALTSWVYSPGYKEQQGKDLISITGYKNNEAKT